MSIDPSVRLSIRSSFLHPPTYLTIHSSLRPPVHPSAHAPVSFCRQELIKYYEELSREVELREARAQWLIRRHRLDTARLQFLAREEAQLDARRREMRAAAATPTPRAPTGEGPARVENQGPGKASATTPTTPTSTPKPTTTPISTPKPSLVTLIASGVKTDALVRASAGRVPEQGPDLEQDVGGLKVDAEDGPSPRDSPQGEPQESGVPSVSSADSVDRGRKTWGEPVSVGLGRGTGEGGAHRKAWQLPAEGDDVKLAEAQLPHGAPSGSSIQFALYADKQLSREKDALAQGRPDTGTQGHPSDSSAQNLLYGPGDATTSNTPSTQGHPSDSSAQTLLYGSGDVATSNTPSTQGHPSDSSAQTLLYGSGDVTTSNTPSTQGHPSDSSAQTLLYGPGDVTTSNTPSTQGHPSDSSAQTLLYGSGDVTTSNTPSTQGHPSDWSAQTLLYGSGDVTTSNTPSTQGHPSDSSAQNLLYGLERNGSGTTPSRPGEGRVDLSRSSRKLWGHPSDAVVHKLVDEISTLDDSQNATRGTPPPSTVQHILYPTRPDSGGSGDATSRGAPPASVVQNLLYPGRGESAGNDARVSTRGREPAVKIKALLYPNQPGEDWSRPCILQNTSRHITRGRVAKRTVVTSSRSQWPFGAFYGDSSPHWPSVTRLVRSVALHSAPLLP